MEAVVRGNGDDNIAPRHAMEDEDAMKEEKPETRNQSDWFDRFKPSRLGISLTTMELLPHKSVG
jgi:hypothetical protein